MTLGQRQRLHTWRIGMLIIYAYGIGYELTQGDAWALKGKGRPHSEESDHYDRCADDLNLFKNGRWLRSAKSHAPLRRYWEEALGGKPAPMKGKDANHYAS